MVKDLEDFLNNDFKIISINYINFEIANRDSFEDLQEGYRLNSKEKKSFIGNNYGDWKENWFVIGYLEGDPVFADVKTLVVYTAMHGIGSWEEEKICDSLNDFKTLVEMLKSLSIGRENPAWFEKNPISKKEIAAYHLRIRDLKADVDFWNLLIE
ncbi:MAG TPA: hypothetical protein VE978_12160 [Chitinophagales bacterium]|nr:hypothetical protein [Chitinophagales bacterium]